MDRLRIAIERGTETGNRRGEQNHRDDRRKQRQLPHVDSHRNTSSSPTPNARAIRNASSSDGAYRPASSAMIVCRVTLQACASASWRSEEHTSELKTLMRKSYAVFCLKKKKIPKTQHDTQHKYIQTQKEQNKKY